MYYIFSILIILINLFFAVSLFFLAEPKKKGNRDIKNSITKQTAQKKIKTVRIMSLIHFIFAALGLVFSIAINLIFSFRLEKSGLTEEFISWANDMYFGYANRVFIFCNIMIILLSVSFFLNRRFSPIRTVVSLASSIIVLIAGFLYSYIASNDTVSLFAYVQMFSMGVSIFLSIPFTYEFLGIFRPLDSEKKAEEDIGE